MINLSKKCERALNSIVAGTLSKSELPKLPMIPKKDQRAINLFQCNITGEVVVVEGEEEILMYKERSKGTWLHSRYMDKVTLIALATHPMLSVHRTSLPFLITCKNMMLLGSYAHTLCGYRARVNEVVDFDIIYIGKMGLSFRYTEHLFKKVGDEYQPVGGCNAPLNPHHILQAIEKGIEIKWVNDENFVSLYNREIHPLNEQLVIDRRLTKRQVLINSKEELNNLFDHFIGDNCIPPSALVGNRIAYTLRQIADKVESEFNQGKCPPPETEHVLPPEADEMDIESCKREYSEVVARMIGVRTTDEQHNQFLMACIARIRTLQDILKRHADKSRQ